MMGAGIPFGAEQRLLPEWIPLSFFALALFYLFFAWTSVVFMADDISTFKGGSGPILGLIHTFTLGVLASTAFGASMQMLPVATGATMSAPRLVITLLVLWVVGTITTLSGFVFELNDVAAIGASLLCLGALLFVGLLMRLLYNAQAMRLIRRHAVLGGVSLICAASLGLAMILSWSAKISFEMVYPGLFHAGFAIYGFMGLIVLGFSRIMVPMLAIADVKSEKPAFTALILILISLLLWMFGCAFGLDVAMFLSPLLGLIAAGLHIFEMTSILKTRLRSRLGPEWLLIRFSWVMLPSSLVFSLISINIEGFEKAAQLAIFLGITGWLVSFILGVLQRIIPFLLSMQIARHTGMPELPSKLSHERLLKIIGPLHISAVFLCSLGLFYDLSALLLIGGLMGSISGCLFITFFFIALSRKSQSLAKMQQPTL